MLRRHYESQAPSETRLATLEELVQRGSAQTGPGWTRRRLAVMLAACTVISAATGALLTFATVRTPDVLTVTTPPSPDVDLIVVQMHADWCKPSQVMATRLVEVRQAQAHGNVLFLKLDLTDEERSRQAELLMASLGYGDIWRSQRGVTGELLLIDTMQRIVLDKLTEADDVPQILAGLSQALHRSSS